MASGYQNFPGAARVNREAVIHESEGSVKKLSAGFLLALLVAGNLYAQDAPEPSRKEILEHDGIIWGTAAAWKIPFQENLGEDAKIAGLSRFWMEAKINFPRFAEVADLDWDKTYIDFLPKVRATKSTYEYYRVLQQMCVLLKDGHSDVFLPPELAERMEADLPLRIDLIGNRVFVTRVSSKALEQEGITEGLEILKIDGLPVHEYANQRRPYITSNSPQQIEVKVYSYGLLSGPRDRPVSVEFRSKDGRVFEKQLARGPRPDATTLPLVEYRKLDGNIAYVALNTFNSEDVPKELEAHLAEIRGSDGLILDVRQNDGGSGAMAYNILGYLTSEDFPTPPWKSRQYIATLRVWGQPGGWWEPKPTVWKAMGSASYTKPVVMLIGPRSLSATDVFAETFKTLRRGLLIGEPTSGSTGDPLGFLLPGGGSARVSTSTDVGTGIIGRGVQPDILVPRTVEDFLAGRDAALAAALSELRRGRS
jgi:carboxyl-terminal processing protease